MEIYFNRNQFDEVCKVLVDHDYHFLMYDIIKGIENVPEDINSIQMIELTDDRFRSLSEALIHSGESELLYSIIRN